MVAYRNQKANALINKQNKKTAQYRGVVASYAGMKVTNFLLLGRHRTKRLIGVSKATPNAATKAANSAKNAARKATPYAQKAASLAKNEGEKLRKKVKHE